MHIHRKAKQSKEKLLTTKVVAHHSLFVVSVFPMVLHTSPLQKSFFLQFVPLTYRRKSNVQGGNLELPRKKAEIIYLDTILGFPRKTESFFSQYTYQIRSISNNVQRLINFFHSSKYLF